MIEKIDFFISPAYSVPPIKTIRSSNEMIINASDCVPSTVGFALNLGADMIVKFSLMVVLIHLSVGRINN